MEADAEAEEESGKPTSIISTSEQLPIAAASQEPSRLFEYEPGRLTPSTPDALDADGAERAAEVLVLAEPPSPSPPPVAISGPEIMFSSDDPGSRSFRSVEETTVVIPPSESVQEQVLDSGDKVYTRLQKTIVVNRRREIVQSCSLNPVEGDLTEADNHIVPVVTSEEGDHHHLSVHEDIRPVTPELVEQIEEFDVPSGVSPENISLIHMPTQQTNVEAGAEEEGLTVRVRHVTRHVTRRVVRKRRRIVRKVVIIDGEERITEEITEEPDEVDEHTSQISSGPVFDYLSTASQQARASQEKPGSPQVTIAEVESEDETTSRSSAPIPGSSRGASVSSQGVSREKLSTSILDDETARSSSPLVLGTPPEDVEALLKVVKIEETKKSKKDKKSKKREQVDESTQVTTPEPEGHDRLPGPAQRLFAEPDSPFDSSKEPSPAKSTTSSDYTSPDEIESKLEITVLSADEYKREREESRRAQSQLDDRSEDTDTMLDISWVDDNLQFPMDEPSPQIIPTAQADRVGESGDLSVIATDKSFVTKVETEDTQKIPEIRDMGEEPTVQPQLEPHSIKSQLEVSSAVAASEKVVTQEPDSQGSADKVALPQAFEDKAELPQEASVSFAGDAVETRTGSDGDEVVILPEPPTPDDISSDAFDKEAVALFSVPEIKETKATEDKMPVTEEIKSLPGQIESIPIVPSSKSDSFQDATYQVKVTSIPTKAEATSSHEPKDVLDGEKETLFIVPEKDDEVEQVEAIGKEDIPQTIELSHEESFLQGPKPEEHDQDGSQEVAKEQEISPPVEMAQQVGKMADPSPKTVSPEITPKTDDVQVTHDTVTEVEAKSVIPEESLAPMEAFAMEEPVFAPSTELDSSEAVDTSSVVLPTASYVHEPVTAESTEPGSSEREVRTDIELELSTGEQLPSSEKALAEAEEDQEENQKNDEETKVTVEDLRQVETDTIKLAEPPHAVDDEIEFTEGDTSTTRDYLSGTAIVDREYVVKSVEGESKPEEVKVLQKGAPQTPSSVVAAEEKRDQKEYSPKEDLEIPIEMRDSDESKIHPIITPTTEEQIPGEDMEMFVSDMPIPIEMDDTIEDRPKGDSDKVRIVDLKEEASQEQKKVPSHKDSSAEKQEPVESISWGVDDMDIPMKTESQTEIDTTTLEEEKAAGVNVTTEEKVEATAVPVEVVAPDSEVIEKKQETMVVPVDVTRTAMDKSADETDTSDGQKAAKPDSTILDEEKVTGLLQIISHDGESSDIEEPPKKIATEQEKVPEICEAVTSPDADITIMHKVIHKSEDDTEKPAESIELSTEAPIPIVATEEFTVEPITVGVEEQPEIISRQEKVPEISREEQDVVAISDEDAAAVHKVIDKPSNETESQAEAAPALLGDEMAIGPITIGGESSDGIEEHDEKLSKSLEKVTEISEEKHVVVVVPEGGTVAETIQKSADKPENEEEKFPTIKSVEAPSAVSEEKTAGPISTGGLESSVIPPEEISKEQEEVCEDKHATVITPEVDAEPGIGESKKEEPDKSLQQSESQPETSANTILEEVKITGPMEPIIDLGESSSEEKQDVVVHPKIVTTTVPSAIDKLVEKTEKVSELAESTPETSIAIPKEAPKASEGESSEVHLEKISIDQKEVLDTYEGTQESLTAPKVTTVAMQTATDKSADEAQKVPEEPESKQEISIEILKEEMIPGLIISREDESSSAVLRRPEPFSKDQERLSETEEENQKAKAGLEVDTMTVQVTTDQPADKTEKIPEQVESKSEVFSGTLEEVIPELIISREDESSSAVLRRPISISEDLELIPEISDEKQTVVAAPEVDNMKTTGEDTEKISEKEKAEAEALIKVEAAPEIDKMTLEEVPTDKPGDDKEKVPEQEIPRPSASIATSENEKTISQVGTGDEASSSIVMLFPETALQDHEKVPLEAKLSEEKEEAGGVPDVDAAQPAIDKLGDVAEQLAAPAESKPESLEEEKTMALIGTISSQEESSAAISTHKEKVTFVPEIVKEGLKVEISPAVETKPSTIDGSEVATGKLTEKMAEKPAVSLEEPTMSPAEAVSIVEESSPREEYSEVVVSKEDNLSETSDIKLENLLAETEGQLKTPAAAEATPPSVQAEVAPQDVKPPPEAIQVPIELSSAEIKDSTTEKVEPILIPLESLKKEDTPEKEVTKPVDEGDVTVPHSDVPATPIKIEELLHDSDAKVKIEKEDDEKIDPSSSKTQPETTSYGGPLDEEKVTVPMDDVGDISFNVDDMSVPIDIEEQLPADIKTSPTQIIDTKIESPEKMGSASHVLPSKEAPLGKEEVTVAVDDFGDISFDVDAPMPVCIEEHSLPADAEIPTTQITETKFEKEIPGKAVPASQETTQPPSSPEEVPLPKEEMSIAPMDDFGEFSFDVEGTIPIPVDIEERPQEDIERLSSSVQEHETLEEGKVPETFPAVSSTICEEIIEPLDLIDADHVELPSADKIPEMVSGTRQVTDGTCTESSASVPAALPAKVADMEVVSPTVPTSTMETLAADMSKPSQPSVTKITDSEVLEESQKPPASDTLKADTEMEKSVVSEPQVLPGIEEVSLTQKEGISEQQIATFPTAPSLEEIETEVQKDSISKLIEGDLPATVMTVEIDEVSIKTAELAISSQEASTSHLYLEQDEKVPTTSELPHDQDQIPSISEKHIQEEPVALQISSGEIAPPQTSDLSIIDVDMNEEKSSLDGRTILTSELGGDEKAQLSESVSEVPGKTMISDQVDEQRFEIIQLESEQLPESDVDIAGKQVSSLMEEPAFGVDEQSFEMIEPGLEQVQESKTEFFGKPTSEQQPTSSADDQRFEMVKRVQPEVDINKSEVKAAAIDQPAAIGEKLESLVPDIPEISHTAELPASSSKVSEIDGFVETTNEVTTQPLALGTASLGEDIGDKDEKLSEKEGIQKHDDTNVPMDNTGRSAIASSLSQSDWDMVVDEVPSVSGTIIARFDDAETEHESLVEDIEIVSPFQSLLDDEEQLSVGDVDLKQPTPPPSPELLEEVDPEAIKDANVQASPETIEVSTSPVLTESKDAPVSAQPDVLHVSTSPPPMSKVDGTSMTSPPAPKEEEATQTSLEEIPPLEKESGEDAIPLESTELVDTPLSVPVEEMSEKTTQTTSPVQEEQPPRVQNINVVVRLKVGIPSDTEIIPESTQEFQPENAHAEGEDGAKRDSTLIPTEGESRLSDSRALPLPEIAEHPDTEKSIITSQGDIIESETIPDVIDIDSPVVKEVIALDTPVDSAPESGKIETVLDITRDVGGAISLEESKIHVELLREEAAHEKESLPEKKYAVDSKTPEESPISDVVEVKEIVPLETALAGSEEKKDRETSESVPHAMEILADTQDNMQIIVDDSMPIVSADAAEDSIAGFGEVSTVDDSLPIVVDEDVATPLVEALMVDDSMPIIADEDLATALGEALMGDDSIPIVADEDLAIALGETLMVDDSISIVADDDATDLGETLMVDDAIPFVTDEDLAIDLGEALMMDDSMPITGIDNFQTSGIREVSEAHLHISPLPEELHLDTLWNLKNQIERSLNQPKGSQALMQLSQVEDVSLANIEEKLNSLSSQSEIQSREIVITEWIEVVTEITGVLERVRYWTQRVDHSPSGADEKRQQYENCQGHVKTLNSILDSMETVTGDDGQPLENPLKERIREVLSTTKALSALVQQFLTDSQEALKVTPPDSAETKWDSESLSRQESFQSSSDQSAPPTPLVPPSVSLIINRDPTEITPDPAFPSSSSLITAGVDQPDSFVSQDTTELTGGVNIKIDSSDVVESMPEPVTVSVEPPTPESQIQYVVKISSPSIAPLDTREVSRETKAASPPKSVAQELQQPHHHEEGEGISITLGPTESVLLTSDEMLEERMGVSGDAVNVTVVPVSHPPPSEVMIEEPTSFVTPIDASPPIGKTHKLKREKKKVTFERKEEEAPKHVPVVEIPGPSDQELQTLEKVVKFKQELQKILSSQPSTLLSGATLDDVPEAIKKTKDKIEGLQQRSLTIEEVIFLEEILEIVETLTIIIQTLRQRSTDLKEDTAHSPADKVDAHGNLYDALRSVDDGLEEVKNTLDKFKMNPEVKDHLYDILCGVGSFSHQSHESLRSNTNSLRDSMQEYTSLLNLLETEKRKLNGLDEKIMEITAHSLVSPSDKLTNLDHVEPEVCKLQQSIYSDSQEVYKWCEENPCNATQLTQQLSGLNEHLISTETLLTDEKDRLAQIISLADEYEQTLQEFSQVIGVAETLVEEKLSVRNLQHLQEELQRNRNFFGNLKRCQQALEKLEYDLDPHSREAHKDLHRSLYNQASSILERAAKRRQQMAVACARWCRLEQGLNEEKNWLSQVPKKIPCLKSIPSGDCERICSIYQSLYSDVIVHQARLMQLRAVSESLLSTVPCSELEGRTDSLVEDLLNISNRITSGLQCLVGFRDAFTNYERSIHRLKSWLQKAEAKMDAISLQPQSHPYDFWELKAQLESQQPLKNECSVLLDSALRILPVVDEMNIRQNFSNFEDRWHALSSIIGQTEMVNYTHCDVENPSVALATRLNAMDKDVSEIKEALHNMVITVESEDDLFCYLEKLQILKAQVLNKKHQLSTLKKDSLLEPKDAERIGTLLAGLSALDVKVTEELETAHVIREKFATFGRMSLKTKRLQDTLRARVDQWASFFELSQDILKQALDNCQNLDDAITDNQVDLEKMHQVVSSFPTSSHVALNTSKLEHELHEMEAAVHTLNARVQDLRKRVKEQLGCWQEYENALNSVSQLIHQSQSTLELVESDPPTSLRALDISERYLNNVEEALRDKSSVLLSLHNLGERLKAESPEDSQREIEKAVESIRAEWRNVEERLRRVRGRYELARHSWSTAVRLKTEISEWVRPIYPQVELARNNGYGESGSVIPADSDLVNRLRNELPDYEEKMSELELVVRDLCQTLFHTQESLTTTSAPHEDVSLMGNDAGTERGEQSIHHISPDVIQHRHKAQLPLTVELEALAKKLVVLRSILKLADQQQQGDGNAEYRKVDELYQKTSDTIASATGIQLEGEASADRLSSIYEHLLSLGNAEGRMKAAQGSSATPATHSTELLHSSRRLFQQIFVEYLKVWKSLTEQVPPQEIFSVWDTYLLQCQSYLKEPIPSSRQHLIEDESLCKVHQTILKGQHSALAETLSKSDPAASREPVNFPELEARYLAIESQLVARLDEIEKRLSRWKNYLACQEAFSSYLKAVEREKRGLELPFLQIKRLEPTRTKMEMLIEKCVHLEELLSHLKAAKDELEPFATTELRASLVHDVASNHARLKNIEAALRTWLGHISRLEEMHDSYQQNARNTGDTLNALAGRLREEKAPPSFSQLEMHIKALEKLRTDAENVTPTLDQARSCVEDMKSSISPTDARLLNQKVWSLTQQQVELLALLQQNICDASEKVDLIPAFDTKCKNWMLWARSMQDKLQHTQHLNLDEYALWLEKEAEPEISSKAGSYSWITENGKRLAEMAGGSEKKELNGAVKQVKQLWKLLNDSLKERASKVTHLQEMLRELNARCEASDLKLKELEKFVGAPVTLEELSGDEINAVIITHEGEQRKLVTESCNINQILNLGQVTATDCDDLKMYQDAFEVRQHCESLDDSWKRLLTRFNNKQDALSQLRARSQKMEEHCETTEALLLQAAMDLGRLEKPVEGNDPDCPFDEIKSQAEQLHQALQALTPKVESIGNMYCFIARHVNARTPGKISQRVKKLIQDHRFYQQQTTHLIDLCRRNLLNRDFHSCYNATNELMNGLLSRTESSIEDFTAGDHYETISNELSSLQQEFLRLNDNDDKLKSIGENLASLDPSLQDLVEQKLLEHSRQKRGLEERLSVLAGLIGKEPIKTAQGDMAKAVQVETLSRSAIDKVSSIRDEEDMEDYSGMEVDERVEATSATGQFKTLSRIDIYLHELEKAIDDSNQSITVLENMIAEDSMEGSSDTGDSGETETYESLVRTLANTQSMFDHVLHLYRILVEEHHVSPEDANENDVDELQRRFKAVEEKARAYGQKLRAASSKQAQVTCPVCTPSQRGAWDSTLWRLEQWLNHAGAKLKQSTTRRPPNSLEDLEEAILRHRELVIDLDSHRSLVSALSGVLTHLNEHGQTKTMGQVELKKLVGKLTSALDKWKKVCHSAAAWQARLQIALIENTDFHTTISQFEETLSSIQETIHRLEPVDLGQPNKVILSKLHKFKDLKEGLLRLEPELATLQQTAEQLFINPSAIEKEGTFKPVGLASDEDSIFITPECSTVLNRISDLNRQLKCLLKVCDAYVKHLSLHLQRTSVDDVSQPSTSLLTFSDEIFEQTGRSSSARARSASPQPNNSSNDCDEPRENQDGVIVRGGRFLMRAVRVSLPIQALVLLLLGATSLLPYGEQDFLCTARNTLQSSLEPMLHYPDGPPPI